MKQKISKFATLILFSFFIALVGCEKEAEAPSAAKSGFNGKINNVTIDDLPSLKKELESNKKYTQDPEFRLVLKHIKQYIDSKGNETYSIPMHSQSAQNSPDYYFENLNVYKSGNHYASFITRYNPDDDSRAFDMKTFTGKLEIFDQNKLHIGVILYKNGSAVRTPSSRTLKTAEEQDTCTTGSFTDQMMCLIGIGDMDRLMDLINNMPVAGSDGETPPNTDDSDTGILIPNYDWEIPTDALARRSYVLHHLEGLSDNGDIWVRQTATDAKIDDIISLLNDEYPNKEWSTHKIISAAKEGINRMIENPELNIDFQASYSSPTFIDLSFVSGNSEEEKKFMCVYNKLTETQGYKDLFLKMFNGDKTKPNVVFKIGDLGIANGKTDPKSAMDMEIIMDRNFLLDDGGDGEGGNEGGTTMDIAKTIIHEGIHAYLNVKLGDPSIGMSIPTLNNMDIADAMNSYYNGKDGDQTQHSFIYAHLVPTMQMILLEVRPSLVSPAKSKEVEGALMTMKDESITGYFNWNGYYRNLSLLGLHNCHFFKAEIGSFNDEGLLTTVNQLKMNEFRLYNTWVSTKLDKTCID
ncbi:hypothetical protein [Flavobacterium sp. LAR06]|uniref:hypothetical protein n=1 Tax=Flavobacterium sp. LAR06 TaxID=3064897 RepID=UPI0035C25A35